MGFGCPFLYQNSLSAANDFSALFPRYVNLRRGSLLCAIIGGWVCVPWLVLANAQSFLNFMSGYTVFIAPIIGIMIADYWCVLDMLPFLPFPPLT